MIETRKAIEGWEASELLAAQGQRDLAKEVNQFVGRMPPLRTDREVIAEELRRHHRNAQAREGRSR